MKKLNNLSGKEKEILSRRRYNISTMYMSILSGEDMKKKEDLLRRQLDEEITRYKVSVDMSSQKEFFINKKRYLMKLHNSLAKTCKLIYECEYRELIINENIDKLLELIEKINFKLSQIELPLAYKFGNYVYDYRCVKDDTTD